MPITGSWAGMVTPIIPTPGWRINSQNL